MSDTAYYENQYEPAPEAGRWRGVLSGIAAAVLSLGMLGGVVAWAYQISVRDAWEVPVVRAIEGPMKQRPEDAGGLKLEETDLAVTRMVSGGGAAEETALAPAPAELAPGDKPVATIREEAELAKNPPAVAGEGPRLRVAEIADDEAGVASAPDEAPASPAARREEAAVATTTGTPVGALEEVDATENAPGSSPLAPRRPESLDTTQRVASLGSTTNTPVTREVIEIGVPVVQLGAFGSPQIAERVWKDQQLINRRLFSGKDATITSVQSGGRELFRLRVGPFASMEEAKKTCVVLKARGGDCIPTRAE